MNLFITFEGLEGAGKSVQVTRLEGKLREIGKDVVVTREPGGTRIGEKIRMITHDVENADLDSASELYLMAASRAQHVREIIKPALDGGTIVISDRFLDSSIAYQGYGRKLGEEAVQQVNSVAVDEVAPSITFFLRIPVSLGLARRNNTAKVDRMDLEQTDFYERVAEGYEQLAKKYPERIVVIDGTKSIVDIAGEIWQKISPFI